MKKTYVKPMAAGVAFVVNENVATSLGNDNKNVGGFKLYQQADGCNTHYFTTAYLTGFENKGEEAAMNPMDNFGEYNKDVSLDTIFAIAADPSNSLNGDYRTCFVS